MVGFWGLCINAQQIEKVDFIKADVIFKVLPDSAKVAGRMQYSLRVLQDVDTIFIDAIKMIFPDGVRLNDAPVRSENTQKRLYLYHHFKKDSLYQITFNYVAYPKQALYLFKRNKDWNIWTQGQGKYTSHWLPSFDDVNEKVIFNFSTAFEKDYEILMNGQRLGVDRGLGGNSVTYVSSNPISSYLVALAIGKYNRNIVYSDSGVALELYYYQEDSLKAEPTYRYTKKMFDFLEAELDYPYPWGVYKQVPVHDFLYAGMENASLTIFSDAFVVDSIGYNDKNYTNINAHELVHQWFGDLVTARSGEHHWLQEGFATYYALLAEKELFGDDYFYFKLYESAQDLARQDDAGAGTSLLNPKSSSLTFYQRGAWVLHALRTKIGNPAFRKAVNSYLKAYAFKSATTEDLIRLMKQESNMDLTDFVNQWILDEVFPFQDAVFILKEQSPFVNEYSIINCEANNSKCIEYLGFPISDEAKVKIISQQPSLINKETFSSGLKVRQAISQYLTTIPEDLKFYFESLLEDRSYVTIESALYNLWVNFPADRSKYLSKTRNIKGFNDLNIRLLWLVLHLNTPEYQPDKKASVYNELLSYTNADQSAEVRMNAFRYLDLMKACNALCQNNLEQAKTHHNWQLVKMAKLQAEAYKSEN